MRHLIGKLIILSTFMLLLVMTSGCIPATRMQGVGKVKIQPRPNLSRKIVESNCDGIPCVQIPLDDWRKIRLWYLTQDRELKAACLANGQTKSECRIPGGN